jgi:hypothetical protein
MQSFLLLLISSLLWFTATTALDAGAIQDIKVFSRYNLARVKCFILHQPRTCGNSSDAVPLFVIASQQYSDFYIGTDINLITSAVNRGYAFLGVGARVFTTQETSTVPFYELYSNSVTDHFFTISEVDRDLAITEGYTDSGITAYIYPTQICGSIPYYQLFNPSVAEHWYTAVEVERDRMVAAGWSDEGIAGYVLDANVCSG